VSSSKFGRHPLARTLSALVLVAASGSAAAATGTAATGSPAKHTYGEIVVGVPDLDLPGAKQAGGVDVYFPDGRKQRLTEPKLGLPDSVPAGRFGASVVVTALNGDRYPDLVVGAPGRPGRKAKGRVVLLFGSAAGFTGEGAQVLSPGNAGDEFGAAVTVSGRTLFVGAPGHDEDRISNSGALYRYALDAQGRTTSIGLLTEASTGLGGVLQENQRFGEVLAPATDFYSDLDVTTDSVVIGLPNKNVGSAAAAGEMVRLHTAPDGREFTAEIWTQNSPGVPGVAEAGDHFGAAVIDGGHAVGVPGEDLGTATDAGEVQIFQIDPARRSYLLPGIVVTQVDSKVPGRAEAGDRFGAALVTGVFNCRDLRTLAIGSPGEDVGTAADAGSVTFVGLPLSVEHLTCAAGVIRQGRGLHGRPEAGDEVGAAIGEIDGDPVHQENTFDTLLIGAPGEDIGTAKAHRNTGRASIWNDYRAHYSQSFGYQGGDLPGLRYGSVFALG
jgi:hypothetical protein